MAWDGKPAPRAPCLKGGNGNNGEVDHIRHIEGIVSVFVRSPKLLTLFVRDCWTE